MSRERVEQGKSLEDPGIVGARVNTSFVGCPADAADGLGELELAVAGGLSVGRAAARAVDRDGCRPMFTDKVYDLPARQASLEHQNPAIIDDRRVEALSLSADINADPRRHASSMPHSMYRPHSDRAAGSDGSEVALGAATATADRNSGEAPARVGCQQRTVVL